MRAILTALLLYGMNCSAQVVTKPMTYAEIDSICKLTQTNFRIRAIPKEYYELERSMRMQQYYLLMRQRQRLIKLGVSPKDLVMPIKPDF